MVLHDPAYCYARQGWRWHMVSQGFEDADKHRRDEIARCSGGDQARCSGACLRENLCYPVMLGSISKQDALRFGLLN